VEEARQEISSIVRQANEDAIADAAHRAGAGSEIDDLAQKFVPTKKRLGRLLEARTAAEKGAVKAAAKPSGPGLPDYLLGSTTGNPAAAYITALASKSLRSRAPAALSKGAYGMFGALEGGTAGSSMARLPALLEMLTNEPSESEKQRAIANALRGSQL
jgi:hypothetical protein